METHRSDAVNCDRCGHRFEHRVDWACYDLRQLGAKVRVRRRKLAHRTKVYLNVEAEGGHWEWKHIIMPTIHRFFPDAYMTSGGFGVKMNVTIALER